MSDLTLPDLAVSRGRRALPQWLGRQGIIAMVVLGPVVATLTVLALASSGQGGQDSTALRLMLLVDLCYILGLTALIGIQIGRLVMARRRNSAGSQLHLRLTGVFALVALVPAVIVAVFATLTVNFGIESWFSDQVGSVVRNSLATAQAYEREHRGNIRGDVLAMANDLNRAAQAGAAPGQLSDLVARQALLRELPEAFIFNGQREILARGEFSYLFSFEPPTDDQLSRARAGEVVIMEDDANDEIRALVALTNFVDTYLYVSRDVQGDVLRLLDDTRATVQLYERLERERGTILFDFALIYLGFALLVILAAILLGLWFAERLARPVGRLAGAARAIGAGDLTARVEEERGTDEIAVLSRAFNQMAAEVESQRDALVEAKADSERRSAFIEAVLSGVTAGVIGLGPDGTIDLINDAACDLLGLDDRDTLGRPLPQVTPAFVPLVDEAQAAPMGVARGEILLSIQGEAREFLARVAPRSPDGPGQGLVVTFDDVSALASAQRMAAWGDVARRIAHEIKNPLTPIQLSADRLRRKFAPRLGEDGADFQAYLDVITRQTGDIRRMVDEFSRFARMPEPTLGDLDLAALVRDSVLLQQTGRGDIAYDLALPARPVAVVGDPGLLGQCLTNLLQNAADAIDQRRETDPAAPARIRVGLDPGERHLRLTVTDSGVGLPREGRDRLTEPYVTTRKKGTGLGLAIVKKIVEQHGGTLSLGDAAPDTGYDGAQVSLRLPRPGPRRPDRAPARDSQPIEM